MDITINPSSVAACINKNAYKSQEETMRELFLKIKRKTKKYLYCPFNKTNDEKARYLLIDNEELSSIKNTLQNSEFTQSININEKNTIVNELINEMNNLDVINDKDKKLVENYTIGISNRTYGSSNEKNIISKYNIFKDGKTYKKEIIKIGFINFILAGKIDGYKIEEDKKIIIEIKNRSKRLFNELKEYENIQVQCYIQLLDNIDKAELIESYNGEENVFSINRDDEKWNNEILPELIKYCEDFYTKLFIENNKYFIS